MYSITVCIPTYKRPEMLNQLILSIIKSNIDKTLIGNLNVIVVDNDADKSAESTINSLKAKYQSELQVNYFSYPVKGLSNVRNELLKHGLELNPDFLVFVDDDEYVTPEWLNELVKTIMTNDGDLTMGPVNSLVNRSISGYISCWLERDDYRNNSRLYFIRTGNLIIRTGSLLKYNIRFDPRFNRTGGEDSYFGVQMIKAGAKIFWASKAIVYETVSEKRTNLAWLFRRYYNGANIFTYILISEKEYLKLSRKIMISIGYIVIGLFGSLLMLIPFEKRYWGPLKLAEGLGGIAGFLSLRYHEYK
jgi:glycosyltransferase involved in cell wall biosynthesis